jgi:hypothetical protein
LEDVILSEIAHVFFLNVPYDLKAGEWPLVAIPSRCIWWEKGGGECDVSRHHWRMRLTGPCHPLAVVKCHHGPAFTLYPPGHYRYGRASVAPVSSDGKLVRVGADDEDVGEATFGKPAWLRTVFAATLDAASGLSWSRESPAADLRRRRTQRRHMALTATLLSLTADLDEAVSQRIAECLGIAYLLLSERRSAYQASPTYHGKGTAMASVLELIPINNTLEHRLLKAGFIGGLWACPKRLDPG